MSIRRRALFWLLALALLLAQALGQMHRTLHGPVLLAQAASEEEEARAPLLADADGFGHLGETDCRLFDQLLHADLLPSLPLALLLLAPPSAVLQQLAGDALVRWVALYDVRGPPLH